MNSYLLGIDLGTSACKVAVFDRNGNALATASGDYPVYYRRPGWAEQDPGEWWQGVCRALNDIWESGKVLPSEIAGIGLDGQGWSAVAVDRDGKCLTNSPIWMDTRASDICERMNREIGADRIFDLCGNALNPSYTTAKVIWYRENLPEVFSHTDKVLQSNAYIAFRLTGEISEDICNAYGWHCLDMRKGCWDLDMAREMGIPAGFLPDIVNCDEIVGRVSEEASQECGLLPGTPVIAGGLDAACGTLGTGAIHAGETQEQGGQAGGMSICLDEYKADPRLILSYHVIPGKWLLQGGTTGGGGVMRWFEREFGAYERLIQETTGESSLTQLNKIAEKIPAGSDGLIFLPYMSGERSPIWNPNARGVFYGLDFSKTKGHMVRACMEGVAFALKHNLDTAERAGAYVNVLRAMGGAANSLLWTQIKADITGKPIRVVSSDTATTLGAAMLAGVGTGYYSSYEEAVSLTVRERREHEPDPANRDVYDREYESYLQLYEHLKDMMS